MTQVKLPDVLVGKNVVVEVNSDDIQIFKTFYSSQLKVDIIQKFGELRVFRQSTMEPLSKVYVKVFCKNQADQGLFFKDGFTDIRGKFIYANASGKSLDDVKLFSILISSDSHGYGSCIKEVAPPGNDSDDREPLMVI